ncbi:MAG: NAD(P)/FAD-dependent oxidoreductase [Planctomycetota bacterium]|nr:MAG: NAD(P)/FAD-dependent oxidoreductase [Planctomycetota bacterium]
MPTRFDAIVVGGGHNGLTAAAYLARAGLRTCVLERRHVLGGAAVSEEVFPGFTFSVCSYVVSLLRPEVIHELDLPRHGLEIIPLDASFTPLPDGRSICRWGDPQRTYHELRRHSPRDADRYPEFGRLMGRLSQFVRPVLDTVPPSPASLDPRELLELLGLGRRLEALGEEKLFWKSKLMTMSAVDYLRQFFEFDPLVATMSVSGIIGTFLGVRSPGTAYVLLHHYMGEIDGAMRSWGLARGGTGSVSLAIARAAQEAGATIRTEAGVQEILVRDGRATGVLLEDGEELEATYVLSGVDPHRTFLRLVSPEHLEEDFLVKVRRYRMRGSSGKVNLALDGCPEFVCRPGVGPHLMGDIAIAPSVDYLERAYDQAKYGRFSERPYLNIVIPSLMDPSVAPPGKHVMSCFVQYAPYALAEGLDWDEQRDAFGEAVIDTIAEYAPDIRERILHKQVLTPLDLEREFGLTEGNIFHGELSLSQLFFLRPVPGWARYRTPVRNLYLCASGAHPGGGVMGAPGRLAARTLLRDAEAGA